MIQEQNQLKNDNKGLIRKELGKSFKLEDFWEYDIFWSIVLK